MSAPDKLIVPSCEAIAAALEELRTAGLIRRCRVIAPRPSAMPSDDSNAPVKHAEGGAVVLKLSAADRALLETRRFTEAEIPTVFAISAADLACMTPPETFEEMNMKKTRLNWFERLLVWNAAVRLCSAHDANSIRKLKTAFLALHEDEKGGEERTVSSQS